MGAALVQHLDTAAMSALASSAHAAPFTASHQRHTTQAASHRLQMQPSSTPLDGPKHTVTRHTLNAPSHCNRQFCNALKSSHHSLVHHRDTALMASHHHQSPPHLHRNPTRGDKRPPSRHFSPSQCHSRRTHSQVVRSQQQPADNTGGQQQPREDSGVPAQAPGTIPFLL